MMWPERQARHGCMLRSDQRKGFKNVHLPAVGGPKWRWKAVQQPISLLCGRLIARRVQTSPPQQQIPVVQKPTFGVNLTCGNGEDVHSPATCQATIVGIQISFAKVCLVNFSSCQDILQTLWHVHLIKYGEFNCVCHAQNTY